MLHDCEGGYEGSVDWFAINWSNVSAHLVVREDGNEATQMVELADNAWHACAFNRRSVGLEMSGFASRSFNVSLLATAARISAYFCHHLQIPVRHARAGVGPGVVSHHDLGPEGGGHHDPSDDPAFMEAFIAMVHDEYRKGHFPDVWEPRKQQKTCALSPDSSKFARVTSIAQAPPDIHTICGLQRRARCSAIALPSMATTAPKRAKPSQASRGTPGLSRMESLAHRQRHDYPRN